MISLDLIIDSAILRAIPQQPQVQCSTTDQLRALHVIATKFGLYDAADAIRRDLERR